MKSREQLERDCASTIKLVLTELESVAALPPEQATEGFEDRRRRVVRKIWKLFKDSTDSRSQRECQR